MQNVPTVDYDIVGSYDNQRYSTINAERTVNMFEYMDANGKRPKSLLPTAGLVNAALNLGSETMGARQTFVFKDAIYSVYGDGVYKTTGNLGSFVTIRLDTGGIGTSTGYVGIDANTFQVIFVDGVTGWIYDTTPGNLDPFQRITDTGFPDAPIDVCNLDGFFVVVHGGTNQFQLSAFNQGMVWSAGNTTIVSANPTTDTITLTGDAGNFTTGVPITLALPTATQASNVFTADSGTDLLTLTGITNANFTTGYPVRVTTTGTLPSPLVAATTYYTIQVSAIGTNPGTIKLAASYADAIANTPIDILTNGTATNTIAIYPQLPAPLVAGPPQTYYVIQPSVYPTPPSLTVKLASSYANAIAGIAIDITSAGGPNNTITVVGQLQLGSITTHPGNIVACNTLHRRLFLFSENYTEVWENAGIGTNLPFRRNNSLLMEVGTPAIASVSVGFDRMFFLAQDRDGLAGVMEVRGTESIPVSNRALDFQLAQYAETTGVSDARGLLIKENGLIFYRLNFTTSNHTFVLNVSMSTSQEPKWHEEEVLNGDRHPAQTHAYFKGNNYYGSYNRPIFYLVDDLEPTNDGEPIRRMRIGRQMTPEGYKRLRIDRWQLDLLQGQQQFVSVSSSFTAIGVDEQNLITDLNDDITTNLGQNIITAESGTLFLNLIGNGQYFTTGTAVTLKTFGALPAPLTVGTIYYVIRIGLGINPAHIKLAASEDDAKAGIAINITSSGTPINIISLAQKIEVFEQPIVFFSYSKDGAQNFGYQQAGTMGKIGETTYRTLWRKLGTTPRGQGFVPKIEFFNQIPFIILGAGWAYEVLPE